MTYTVTKRFNVKEEFASTLEHSTMNDFKANVMRINEFTEADYVDALRNANIPDWDEKESAYILARARKTESFDLDTKTYIVSREWDSIDQWNDHLRFHELSAVPDEFTTHYVQSIDD